MPEFSHFLVNLRHPRQAHLTKEPLGPAPGGSMAPQPDLGEDTRSPADRRHQRTVITMLVLAGLVFIAGLYAWGSITDPDESSDRVAAPTCQPAAPTDAPPPAEIALNVYNATDRNGLASSVAGEMRTRG